MATEILARIRRLGMPAGFASLALLLYEVGRESIFVHHDLASIGDVTAATLANRASQLKPVAWKAPWAEWILGVYLLVMAAIVVAMVVAGVRAVFRGDASD